jgi:predicted RNA-binding Zn ribbon-like protein
VDFGHYSDASVALAVDLVNSLGSVSGAECLQTPDDVRELLTRHGIRPPRSIGPRDIAAIHDARARLRAIFDATDDDEAMRQINSLLVDAGALPQVTNHDGRWHLHYVPADAPIARRVGAAAAMGLAAVICEFGRDRLGTCSATNCDDVFVDTSRNRSRRYCDDTCSTRMNVAAYRARHRKPVVR